MSLDLWLLYFVTAIGLSLTHGPNGLLSLTHGVRFGVRRTVFTALGGVTGFTALIGASLAGLGALLAASEQAFTIAKWVGAGYLVYLGIRTWQAPPTAMVPQDGRGAPGNFGPGRLFREGLLVAVSNPKALIFFAAFLPQFIDPHRSLLLQFALLAGTFVLTEFVTEYLLAAAAHRISPWLARVGKRFNRVCGGVFVAIGAALPLRA